MASKRSGPKSGLGRKLDWMLTAGQLATSEIAHGFRKLADAHPDSTAKLLRIQQATVLAARLASLKGAAMKLGQLLALEARDYFPDEVVQILEKLQASADPIDEATIREILARELGARAQRLDNFASAPLAAASIGQVHRAEVEGAPVAVKIQYPGIDKSLDTDIELLKQLVKMISYISGKRELNADSLVDEISSMFAQEMDYRQELQFLTEFRELARSLPQVSVPQPYPDLSTSRVLTLEYVSGLTLSHVTRQQILTDSQRQFFADLFMRLYTVEFCEWGLVQTDPNLGNFLIDPHRDQLILLDFGACRRYSADFRRDYCRLVLAAYRSDRRRLLRIAAEMGLLDPREAEAAQAAFVTLIVQSMEPFRRPLFDFADGEYVAQMRRLTQDLMRQLKFSPPPRELIFLHRKLGGIFQILRRLEAKSNLHPYLAFYEKTAAEA